MEDKTTTPSTLNDTPAPPSEIIDTTNTPIENNTENNLTNDPIEDLITFSKEIPKKQAGNRVSKTVNFTIESYEYLEKIYNQKLANGEVENFTHFILSCVDMACNLGYFIKKQYFFDAQNHTYKLLPNGSKELQQANIKHSQPLTTCK